MVCHGAVWASDLDGHDLARCSAGAVIPWMGSETAFPIGHDIGDMTGDIVDMVNVL